MADLITFIVVLLFCTLGLWVASRIEPHWVSKDGRRFIARVQVLNPDGSTGRWREVRSMITPDGALMITTRGRVGGRIGGIWAVVGKSEEPPAGREIYLLDGLPQLALRIPARSKVVATLDEFVARKPRR